MSSDDTSEPVLQLENRLFKCYTDLLSLINSFEKGSTADITARLRSVENDLQELREAVIQTPDINSEEAYQFKKIRDLYSKKMTSSTHLEPMSSTQDLNNLFESCRNEKAILCKHCMSIVILPNVGLWSNKTIELPLARQQKGVDTQKESLSGFWTIGDMMSFENVGFTNSVEGIKYLICADCEYGPIGFLDNETRLHFITPSRLMYKD